MKMSKLFVQTLREYPSDAEVISHKLLVKAGFIRKLTNGVYIYLPLMYRVLQKVENIVREEMNKASAQELLMPFIQPKELWEQSGRWDVYGKELMRFKDRHNREVCLGPTHEEIITFVAREGIRSYKQLPVNLYQIQSKFRDEIRPRFGLLRGREFIMKDAYSFDRTEEGLDKEYKNMADTYKRIFNRCGLETKMVQSDSGAIGGAVSHEFMVIMNENCDVNSGENDVFFCEKCNYSANSNHAVSILPEVKIDAGFKQMEIVDTPSIKTIADLEKFFNIESSCILKTVVYVLDNKHIAIALIRADKQVEETKLKNYFKANDIRPAREDEIIQFMKDNNIDVEPGFLSIVNMDVEKNRVVADLSCKDLKNFICGANQNDKHIVGANWGIDIPMVKFADIRLVEEGELCPECRAKMKVTRGIEVGNIFKLGTKYSKAMNATYTDENGKEQPFIMGCYGIGVSRTAASAVEVHNDQFGIKWPVSIAPYHCIVVPVNIKDENQMKVSEYIYKKLLESNIEAVLDDRAERAGVKFKDADLIGFPYRINVGKSLEKSGLVELHTREDNQTIELTLDQAINSVISEIKSKLG